MGKPSRYRASLRRRNIARALSVSNPESNEPNFRSVMRPKAVISNITFKALFSNANLPKMLGNSEQTRQNDGTAADLPQLTGKLFFAIFLIIQNWLLREVGISYPVPYANCGFAGGVILRPLPRTKRYAPGLS